MEVKNNKIHHGQNVKLLRYIFYMKQNILAENLNISQQSVSRLEAKERIDEETIEKIATLLKIPVETIKKLSNELIINFLMEAYGDSSEKVAKEAAIHFLESINEMLIKKVELYENLLKEKDKRLELLEKQILELNKI